MSLQSYLTEQLQTACPIVGVSFGDLNDKSTWAVQYDPAATTEQQAAANDVLNAFTWDAPTQEIDRKQMRDAQYENDLSVKAGLAQYQVANPTATLSQYLDYLETLQ